MMLEIKLSSEYWTEPIFKIDVTVSSGHLIAYRSKCSSDNRRDLAGTYFLAPDNQPTSKRLFTLRQHDIRIHEHMIASSLSTA